MPQHHRRCHRSTDERDGQPRRNQQNRGAKAQVLLPALDFDQQVLGQRGSKRRDAQDSGVGLCFQGFKFTEIFTHDLPQPIGFRPPPVALEFAG